MALTMVAIEFVMTAIGVATIIQMKIYSWQWYIIGCGAGDCGANFFFILTGSFSVMSG